MTDDEGEDAGATEGEEKHAREMRRKGSSGQLLLSVKTPARQRGRRSLCERGGGRIECVTKIITFVSTLIYDYNFVDPHHSLLPPPLSPTAGALATSLECQDLTEDPAQRESRRDNSSSRVVRDLEKWPEIEHIASRDVNVLFNMKPKHANLPPGSTGWPMTGENIDFVLSGPQKFVFDRVTKFSPELFRTSLWGEKMAVFCGTQGNKFLFLNENKLVTAWWPLSMRKALVFPQYAQMAVKEVAMAKRVVVLEFLKPEFLKSYIPIMDAMAHNHMERDWAPNSKEVKVFVMSKKYTFALACRIFMSLKDPQRVAKLAKHFNDVIAGLLSVPIDLPGFAYNRAIKAGVKIREELLTIIREKREELKENKEEVGQDLLSRLLLQMKDVDEFVSSMEACNGVIGLLVASYDTTSSAVTFVIKYLAELPHIYDKVYKGNQLS
ncbi:hypothetical protein LguiB_009802 [Lonicera macranthoides]